MELSFSEPADPVHLQGRACYRMVASVDSAHNLPREIFVHQRSQPIGVDGRVIDEFIGVAGPYDLVSMSDSVPDARQMLRKNTVSMLLTSPELAEDFKEEITLAVKELLDSLSRVGNLVPSETLYLTAPISSTTT